MMPEAAPRTIRSQPIRELLLYSGVPVGLVAVGFILGTYALLGLPPSGHLLVLAFCGTFLVYQAERALWPAPEDALNHPQRLAWNARHRGYGWGAAALAALGALATLPFLRPATLGVGGGLALVSLLYQMPLLPRRRRLKSLALAKPVAIAGAWAVGGVLLPVLQAGASVGGLALGALLAYRFCFVLPNALLADWPDRAGDAAVGLRTPALTCTAWQLHGLAAAFLLPPLVGGVLALGLVARPALLLLDLGGPVLMLALVGWSWRRTRTRFFYGYLLDLAVAWPALTAALAGLRAA